MDSNDIDDVTSVVIPYLVKRLEELYEAMLHHTASIDAGLWIKQDIDKLK